MKCKSNRKIMFIVILAILIITTVLSINITSSKQVKYNLCRNEEGPVFEAPGNNQGHKTGRLLIST